MNRKGGSVQAGSTPDTACRIMGLRPGFTLIRTELRLSLPIPPILLPGARSS